MAKIEQHHNTKDQKPPLTSLTRGTCATVNLSALVNNFVKVKRLSPNSKHIAVVKADAYGNGAEQVVTVLSPHADMFAVAFLDEALKLIANGVTLPILVLQGPYSKEELRRTHSLNLHWVLHTEVQVSWFDELFEDEALDGHQWLKFDTGMHRLGLPTTNFERLKNQYAKVFSDNGVLMTHLACADEPESEHAWRQTEQFLAIVKQTNMALSIANSAAAINLPKARKTYNRIGISTYGSTPFYNQELISLEPVMSLTAPIIAIREIPKGDTVGYGATWLAQRDSLIATVAIGYADGYPRHAPSGTPAIVKGQRVKLVGRVSMDMLTFDVTDLSEVEIGDIVELWGKYLPINEVAQHIGTIGYELMTRVSQRVPRRYIEEDYL
ncbi:alanine racemase [Agaribacter flavus]|uniref:Alanine racemase n=1 Tax=Agaribacter flavus TaxID=1902781 RepID=A0ABV7FWH9_9ALTE